MFNVSDVEFAPWRDYKGREYDPATLCVKREAGYRGWFVKAYAPEYYDGRLTTIMARPSREALKRCRDKRQGFRTRRDALEVCAHMRDQAGL